MPLAETQRQTEWENFVEDKGKGQSRCALIGVRGAGGRQTRKGNGMLCDWLGESVWPSVIGPELEGGTHNRELAVSDCDVPVILGRMLQGSWAGFLSWW